VRYCTIPYEITLSQQFHVFHRRLSSLTYHCQWHTTCQTTANLQLCYLITGVLSSCTSFIKGINFNVCGVFVLNGSISGRNYLLKTTKIYRDPSLKMQQQVRTYNLISSLDHTEDDHDVFIFHLHPHSFSKKQRTSLFISIRDFRLL
jgi:hypothetical protein